MTFTKLYYTLKIADDLAQDVPALDIRVFPPDFEPPSPSVVGDVSAIAFTPAQKPLLGGALSPRLQWAIACHLTETESAQLGALYRWQQTKFKDKADGRLLWTDRFELTEPEPAGSLTRDITDAVTTTYGMVYGAPVVNCVISKPQRPLVSKRAGVAVRQCSFLITEYRP